VDGNIVTISSVGGMTRLNADWCVAGAVAGATFQLMDAATCTIPLDSSSFTAWIATTGTVAIGAGTPVSLSGTGVVSLARVGSTTLQAPGHAFVDGNIVTVSSVANMTQLNADWCVTGIVAGQTFQLMDTSTCSNAVDSSQWPTLSGTAGRVTLSSFHISRSAHTVWSVLPCGGAVVVRPHQAPGVSPIRQHMLCRFDVTTVNARVLDNETIVCQSPPHPKGEDFGSEHRRKGTSPPHFVFCSNFLSFLFFVFQVLFKLKFRLMDKLSQKPCLPTFSRVVRPEFRLNQ
jgi:hypothetical protein